MSSLKSLLKRNAASIFVTLELIQDEPLLSFLEPQRDCLSEVLVCDFLVEEEAVDEDHQIQRLHQISMEGPMCSLNRWERGQWRIEGKEKRRQALLVMRSGKKMIAENH